MEHNTRDGLGKAMAIVSLHNCLKLSKTSMLEHMCLYILSERTLGED